MMSRVSLLRSAVLLLLAGATALAAETPAKPRIAVFPLGGNATAEQREKVAFSLRAKLDRLGAFEVVDGPKMAEIAREFGLDVTAATTPAQLKEAADLAEANILIWGELSATQPGMALKVNLLDRASGGKPLEVSKSIAQPTDLRFAVEEVLQALPQVSPFEHPSEQAVRHDAAADELWRRNPNLVVNGDFSAAGKWKGIYQSELYDVAVQDDPPATDKVVIQRLPGGEQVLAMKLSRVCAENNGLACLSDEIKIEPHTRYRLSFRYKSNGPMLHVFVKGYTAFPNVNGEVVQREIYRRQVPVTGSTKGEWVTIEDEMNPQHVQYPVQTLRVDLYAYLHSGEVSFDDVVLKAVGEPTRDARDAAIKKAATRPRGADR